MFGFGVGAAVEYGFNSLVFALVNEQLSLREAFSAKPK